MAVGDSHSQASVSVRFTGDALELAAALKEMSQNAQDTASAIEEAFSGAAADVTADLDDISAHVDKLSQEEFAVKGTVEGDAKEKLDEIKKDADELGQKKPEVKPGVNAKDAETTKASLDDLKADADKLDEKRPEVKPGVSDTDYEATKDKLRFLNAVADELDRKRPKVKPGVSDPEYEEFKAKLRELRYDADKLGDKRPTIHVKVDDAYAKAKLDELAAKAKLLSTEHVKITVDSKGGGGGIINDLKNLLNGEGGGKGPAKVALDLPESALGKFLSKALITIPAAGAVGETLAGAAVGALVGFATDAIGGGAFGLATSGSNNPVKKRWEQALGVIMTRWDKSLAGFTMPALDSTLKPLEALLADFAPDVKAFSKGLEPAMASIASILSSPSMKRLAKEASAATQKDVAGMGPVVGNILKGITNTIVAAQPLVAVVLKAFQSVTAEWANGSGGASFFKTLAADFQQFGPLVGQLLGQLGSDLGDFARAVQPLMGPALKGVNEAGKIAGTLINDVLAPILRGVGAIEKALESLPGGNVTSGIVALALVIPKLRDLLFQVAKLGTIKGLKSLPGVGGLFSKLFGQGTDAKMAAAGRNMLQASENMLKAASGEETAATGEEAAATEEKAAGGEQVLGGEEDIAANGGKSILGKLSGLLGKLGLPAVIAAAVYEIGKSEYNAVFNPGKGAKQDAAFNSDLNDIANGMKLQYGANTMTKADWQKVVAFMHDKPGTAVSGTHGMYYKSALNIDLSDVAAGRKPQYKLPHGWQQQTLEAFEKAALGSTAMGQYGFEATKKKMGNYGKEAGKAMNDGLVAGLKGSLKEATSAATHVADAVITTSHAAYKIKSPSKVFYDIGFNLMQGEANGILAGMSLVTSAAAKVASSVAVEFNQMLRTAGANGVAQAAINRSVPQLLSSPTVNINVASLTGTLPPPVIDQVGTVVQKELAKHEKAMMAGARGL